MAFRDDGKGSLKWWQADVGNLISGCSAFSKTSLNIRKFTVCVLLKPGLENFEYYFTSVWDECNCAVVWAFFGIAFLWDWNENCPFPVLWPLLSFPNLLAYWVQHFHTHLSSCCTADLWPSPSPTPYLCLCHSLWSTRETLYNLAPPLPLWNSLRVERLCPRPKSSVLSTK